MNLIFLQSKTTTFPLGVGDAAELETRYVGDVLPVPALLLLDFQEGGVDPEADFSGGLEVIFQLLFRPLTHRTTSHDELPFWRRVTTRL